MALHLVLAASARCADWDASHLHDGVYCESGIRPVVSFRLTLEPGVSAALSDDTDDCVALHKGS